MTKRLYIETVGCQMNVLDSELIVSGLVQAGYEVVDSPRNADTILYNTCSVRQHAEDKIYSALGRLRPLKERQAGNDHRRLGLHGAEGPGPDLPPRRARRSGCRAGPIQPPAGDSRRSRRRALPPAAAGSEPRSPEGRPLAGRAELSPTSIRRVRPNCGPRRFRRWCGSCSAATSSAPIASCPRSAARSRAVRPARSSKKSAAWPPTAAWRSRCWARRSTATRTRAKASRCGSPICWRG